MIVITTNENNKKNNYVRTNNICSIHVIIYVIIIYENNIIDTVRSLFLQKVHISLIKFQARKTQVQPKIQ